MLASSCCALLPSTAPPSYVPSPDRRYRASELAGKVADIRQLARVETYTGSSGARRARLTAADGFDAEVLLDRGMDLGPVTWRGIPIGFCTPALWQAPPSGDGAENFARRFGAGMLTTCGLDQFGAPNVDAGQELPQHGRATELPAADVATDGRWTARGYEISLSGKMRQWRLFGEDLGWQRRISTVLGSNGLLIADTITNHGPTAWPHMILYHFNLGYPLLDGGTTVDVVGQAAPPVPRDATAAAGLADWKLFPDPASDFPEQVFRHALDPAGPGRLRVDNPTSGLSLTITVDPTALPWAFQWKSAAANTYVLGIEPANCPTVDGRSAARAMNALAELAPGESRSYHVELSVDSG